MKISSKWFVLLFVLFCVMDVVANGISSDARQVAEHVVGLKHTELKKRLHQQVDQVARGLKNRDESAVQRAHARIESVNLVDSVAVFIGGRFTSAELQEIIRFMNSAVGKKFLPFIAATDELFIAYGSVEGIDVFEVLRAAHPQQLNTSLNMNGVVQSARETIRRLQKRNP